MFAASNGFYRDPSAWYHLVSAYEAATETVRQFVNGELVITAVVEPQGNNALYYIGENWGVYHFEGYMAAVYLIDGQALEPTTFGRFNSQGVWVPVGPQGLTYGS